MVWIQSLTRRRQSQSSESPSRSQRSFFGGSKNKRRTVRKDSVLADGDSSLSCSVASDNAPWRVGMFVDLTFCYWLFYDGILIFRRLLFSGNIRPSAPKPSEWWQEDTALESSFDTTSDESSSGTEEKLESFLAKSQPGSMKFHNCGLETWLRAREQWNKRTVSELPARPTPAEYSQLARGLKKHSTLRNYELPRQMALSDLIDVYTDIWEGGV
eukprot:scaffold5024_cov136-Cylindrotheca_fusiformis.AAC.39